MLKYYTTNRTKKQALFLLFLRTKNLLITLMYNIIIEYVNIICCIILFWRLFELEFVYLDSSATTKPCDQALSAINNCLCENWGNPSSTHTLGLTAAELLESSRKTVADFIGAKESDVIFTSGGTEANNMAIFGATHINRHKGNKIVASAIEHPSVLEPLKELEKKGFNVVLLSPDKDGKVSEDALRQEIDDKTALVSLMLVNNEIGTIQPVEKAARIIKEKRSPALLHCDAVQAFGKLPIKVSALGVDLLSASGHKIHASKGIGFLYKSSALHIPSIIFGGGQESGLRSGTEALPLIAGFAAAIKAIDIKKNDQKMRELLSYAKDKLSELDFISFNSPSDCCPYILNVSVNGYKSEPMLNALSANNIFVSKGSACAKGHRSHVLSAMGFDNNRIDSAIRISFSRYNTQKDIDILCHSVKEITAKMRRFK